MNKDKVVLGSCLDSVLYSHKHNIPIILTRFAGPTEDEVFESPMVLAGLEFNKKIEAWTYLKFALSLKGLVINHKEPDSVRLGPDHVRIINTNNALNVKFGKCYLFQDRHTKTELDVEDTLNKGVHKVLDHMKIRVGTHKGLHEINCPDGYLDKLVLDEAEVIGVSYLTTSQLNDFDYSDTITRFTAQKLLQDSELITLPYVDKEKKFKRKLTLEVIKRDVIPMELTIYKNTEKVKNFGIKKRPSK